MTVRDLTASMLVFDLNCEDVLLVKHKASGLMQFPGGHVDPNESPCEAALREVQEETGIRAILDLQPPSYWVPAGMRQLGVPFQVMEIPAPAKPARPGKPAEDPHSHIDYLFVGRARRAIPRAAEQELDGAAWMPIYVALRSASSFIRSDVPILIRAALREIAHRDTDRKGSHGVTNTGGGTVTISGSVIGANATIHH